jgi:hypothetical protein
MLFEAGTDIVLFAAVPTLVLKPNFPLTAGVRACCPSGKVVGM